MLQFVYVLVSTEKDYYTEQALASIYSLKLHNPEVKVCLVTDTETFDSLRGNRSRIKEFADDFVTVKLPEDLNQHEKSRHLKTSVRQLVKGDFVFIDDDTIVTGRLDDVEDWDFDIGAVSNCHTDARNCNQLKRYMEQTGLTEWGNEEYYNTGFLWVRDNEKTRKFYKDWHELWDKDRKDYKIYIDQPTFGKALELNPGTLKELTGEYNCQIITHGSRDFIHDAKMVHYFNSDPQMENKFPMNNGNFLSKIRAYGINEEIKNVIQNPLDYFKHWKILDGRKYSIYNSPLVQLAIKISEKSGLANGFANLILRFYK